MRKFTAHCFVPVPCARPGSSFATFFQDREVLISKLRKKEIQMARSASKGYSEYWSTLLMFYEDSCCVVPSVLYSFLGTMPSPLCNRLGAITWMMLAILYIWYLELASLMVYGHIYIDLSQSEVIIPILWHWNSMKNETPLMGQITARESQRYPSPFFSLILLRSFGRTRHHLYLC